MMYSRSGRKARKEQKRINAEIERQLQKDNDQASRQEMKLIVLGQWFPLIIFYQVLLPYGEILGLWFSKVLYMW